MRESGSSRGRSKTGSGLGLVRSYFSCRLAETLRLRLALIWSTIGTGCYTRRAILSQWQRWLAMHCPACGNRQSDGVFFCGECGAQIESLVSRPAGP